MSVSIVSVSMLACWCYPSLYPCVTLLQCDPLFPSSCNNVFFFFCHISVWCQGLEVFVAFPPAAMSAPGHGAEMAAVFISNRGVAGRPSLEAATTHSFCLSLQYFFFGGKAPKTLVRPNLCFFAGPPPWGKCRSPLHTHTPCPPCLDWFSVCILEGITAICRLLRNKGDSSLSSLQHFRGITWPDKHALAPHYTCSLFCFDLSTHPNCPLYLKADHIILLHPHSALWIEPTHRFLENTQSKKPKMSQCLCCS